MQIEKTIPEGSATTPQPFEMEKRIDCYPFEGGVELILVVRLIKPGK